LFTLRMQIILLKKVVLLFGAIDNYLAHSLCLICKICRPYSFIHTHNAGYGHLFTYPHLVHANPSCSTRRGGCLLSHPA
jgi:hypothetical protein